VKPWVCVASLVAVVMLLASVDSHAAGELAGAPGSMPPAAAAVPAPNAVVQQPRSFGHVIGDIVTQRVRLSLAGHEFEPAELPGAGRISIWFERRSVRVERDVRGDRWLVVDYQLLNSPQVLAAITLPAWKMMSRDAREELRIAAWPMTVAPLTPKEAFARVGLGALRPDRSATPIALEPLQQSLFAAGTALVVTVLAWVGWWVWRNRQSAASRPFAVALREMRSVDDNSPEAWHALHRAFDGTAGQTLRAESLPNLFQRAPQLQPLRPAIERFFQQSAARFFAGAPVERPIGVRVLCRQLRQIEKRHEQ
jgi:mxaA protein